LLAAVTTARRRMQWGAGVVVEQIGSWAGVGVIFGLYCMQPSMQIK